MTAAEKAVAGLAVLAAVVAAGWALVHHGAGLAVAAELASPYDERLAHLCQPHEMGETVHARHPLYRRHDGHAMRAALAGGGWDWFLNPPAQANL